MGGALLATAAVAYNALINRWRPFATWAYLPANLVAGTATVVVGALVFDLDRAAMGLTFDGASLAVPWMAAIALGLAAAVGVPRARPAMRDRRIEGLSGARAALHVLVRIPFGTALFEEVVFRGVLFAALASNGTTTAVIGSSIAFGLWHLEPARQLVTVNRPRAAGRTVAGVVIVSVVTTTGAGLFFAWLRVHGEGIAAPVLVHAAANSFAATAGLLAWRLR